MAVVLVDHALADDRAGRDPRPVADAASRRATGVADRVGFVGERTTAAAILSAMAVGDINYYVLKPWIERDELFHRTVAEFIQEWSRYEVANLREVVVIASDHSVRGQAIRSLLARNGIPSAFRVSGSPLARTPYCAGSTSRIPVTGVLVWMPAVGGTVLHDPTDAEIAEAWGVPTTLADGRGRVRRPGDRCRSGWAGGGCVCVVRGAADARGGAGGDRRAGGDEFADPQLSRVLARDHGGPNWRSAGISRRGSSGRTSC